MEERKKRIGTLVKKWGLPLTLSVLLLQSCNYSGKQHQNKNSTSSQASLKENKNVTASAMKTIIVDVRTKQEWDNDGHADCSVNYPLDRLMDNLDELKKYDSITLVCRSGARATHAQELLYSAGIKNTENKGSWKNIDCK